MSPTTTDSAAGGMLPEPFLDWQAVWPGTSGYETDGRAYTVGTPRGVRLAVQQAAKSERLIELDRPWEEGRTSYPSALCHDGAYHLWYGIGTSEQYPHGALCYASPGIVPLSNGLWGVLCRGIRSRHNEGYAGLHPDREGLLTWAMWQECAPLRGDSLSAPVTWNGRGDLAALRGERIAIRISMSRARLFSVAC